MRAICGAVILGRSAVPDFHQEGPHNQPATTATVPRRDLEPGRPCRGSEECDEETEAAASLKEEGGAAEGDFTGGGQEERAGHAENSMGVEGVGTLTHDKELYKALFV